MQMLRKILVLLRPKDCHQVLDGAAHQVVQLELSIEAMRDHVMK